MARPGFIFFLVVILTNLLHVIHGECAPVKSGSLKPTGPTLYIVDKSQNYEHGCNDEQIKKLNRITKQAEALVLAAIRLLNQGESLMQSSAHAFLGDTSPQYARTHFFERMIYSFSHEPHRVSAHPPLTEANIHQAITFECHQPKGHRIASNQGPWYIETDDGKDVLKQETLIDGQVPQPTAGMTLIHEFCHNEAIMLTHKAILDDLRNIHSNKGTYGLIAVLSLDPDVRFKTPDAVSWFALHAYWFLYGDYGDEDASTCPARQQDPVDTREVEKLGGQFQTHVSVHRRAVAAERHTVKDSRGRGQQSPRRHARHSNRQRCDPQMMIMRGKL